MPPLKFGSFSRGRFGLAGAVEAVKGEQGFEFRPVFGGCGQKGTKVRVRSEVSTGGFKEIGKCPARRGR